MRTGPIAFAFLTATAFGQLQPDPIQKIEPEYTEEARTAGLEGMVYVEGMILDGSLRDLHVTQSLGLGLDEKAIAAVSQWKFENSPTPSAAAYAIDFTLPSKQSRWHLVGVQFQPPDGVLRPTFERADYPAGAGIGVAAYDEGRILQAIGRSAKVTLAFDVDTAGYPANFKVVDASADMWGPQAAILVSTWRFHPGTRGGIPVSVPCTATFLWGPEDYKSYANARQVDLLYPPSGLRIPPESRLGQLVNGITAVKK